MLRAWYIEDGALRPLAEGSDLSRADWIDLSAPSEDERAAVGALGLDAPTLEDMEEIEISNRLYRQDGCEVMTVTIPGRNADDRRIAAPVAFVLSERRMMTVRYHAPRAFETFDRHAPSTSAGCISHLHLFLGLFEEIVARLADLLEGDGQALDRASQTLFDGNDPETHVLEQLVREIGRRGESVASLRHALLTLDRALTTFGLWRDERSLRPLLKATTRDIQALIVHADFLSARVAQLTGVTLGLVNLDQTEAGRVLSVGAVIFLPPTLVASIYGMNFGVLPGTGHPLGWLMASGLMVVSVIASILYFRWKGWL
ncbi:MAG TPA: magnesium transporter [Gammaproteobacteria bacterium]|nr:magnesium transporter [Gammaproteobacteria bacterium]